MTAETMNHHHTYLDKMNMLANVSSFYEDVNLILAINMITDSKEAIET
jgi:hypothetical protein